jgi:hypothetical protein
LAEQSITSISDLLSLAAQIITSILDLLSLAVQIITNISDLLSFAAQIITSISDLLSLAVQILTSISDLLSLAVQVCGQNFGSQDCIIVFTYPLLQNLSYFAGRKEERFCTYTHLPHPKHLADGLPDT